MNGLTTMFGFLSRVVLTTNSLFRFLLHQGQIIHTSVIGHNIMVTFIGIEDEVREVYNRSLLENELVFQEI